MKLLVVFSFVCAIFLDEHAASSTGRPEGGDEIKLAFTIRDFLPITCGTQEHINNFWGPPTILSMTHECPYSYDIEYGEIIPHPDFQVGFTAFRNMSDPRRSSYYTPSGGTPGFLNPLQSPPMQVDRNGNLIPVSKMFAITPLVKPRLKVDANSGLGKPEYCSAHGRCGVPYHLHDPEWRFVNPAWQQYNIAASSGKDMFDLWYEDDLRYNRRVGISLTLTRVEGTENDFEYDSENQFHPLDPFLTSNPGSVFPLTRTQESRLGRGRKYFFTSEFHSFFEYRTNQSLEFQGDDDFMCFINGILAVDLSGLHKPLQSSINLDEHRDHLGLLPGEIYALDIFHAERRMTQSNFKMTTSLVQGCTILRSGATSFNLSNSEGLVKHVGSRMDSEKLILGNGEFNLPSYAFISNRKNIANGFSCEFTISSRGKAEGFALVLHRDPNQLFDMNGGSHGNLGIKHFRNAVAVAFDLCADRQYTNSICFVQEVRLHSHFKSDPSGSTLLGNVRLRKRIQYFPSFMEHHVRVVYYGQRPSWLDVFIDDSLYLSLRGVELTQELGGEDVFIGLTHSTGTIHNAEVHVHNWSLTTVGISPVLSQVSLQDQKLSFEADGVDKATIGVISKDKCGHALAIGGHASHISATVYVSSLAGRLLQQGESRNETMTTTVVDNDNGTYTIEFSSTKVETYSVDIVLGTCPDNCRRFTLPDVFTGTPPTPKEKTRPESDHPWNILVGILVGMVALVLFCCITALFLTRSRKRWQRNKQYVIPGQLAVLSNEVQLTVNNPMETKLGELYQRNETVKREVLWRQSHQLQASSDIEQNIQNQSQEILSQVRHLKEKKQASEINALTISPLPMGNSRRFEPGPEMVNETTDAKQDFILQLSHPHSSFQVQVNSPQLKAFVATVFKVLEDKDFGIGTLKGRFGPGKGIDAVIEKFDTIDSTGIGQWLVFKDLRHPQVTDALQLSWNLAKEYDKYMVLSVHVQNKPDLDMTQVNMTPILFEYGSSDRHKYGTVVVNE